MQTEDSKRAIVTVIGIDHIGIIAKITGKLAERNANILDITQTIMEDIFTMSMVIDYAKASVAFDQLKEELVAIGTEIGLEIHAQREDIFRYMHRI
jgi:ACT domain-containing protein